MGPSYRFAHQIILVTLLLMLSTMVSMTLLLVTECCYMACATLGSNQAIALKCPYWVTTVPTVRSGLQRRAMTGLFRGTDVHHLSVSQGAGEGHIFWVIPVWRIRFNLTDPPQHSHFPESLDPLISSKPWVSGISNSFTMGHLLVHTSAKQPKKLSTLFFTPRAATLNSESLFNGPCQQTQPGPGLYFYYHYPTPTRSIPTPVH